MPRPLSGAAPISIGAATSRLAGDATGETDTDSPPTCKDKLLLSRWFIPEHSLSVTCRTKLQRVLVELGMPLDEVLQLCCAGRGQEISTDHKMRGACCAHNEIRDWSAMQQNSVMQVIGAWTTFWRTWRSRLGGIARAGGGCCRACSAELWDCGWSGSAGAAAPRTVTVRGGHLTGPEPAAFMAPSSCSSACSIACRPQEFLDRARIHKDSPGQPRQCYTRCP